MFHSSKVLTSQNNWDCLGANLIKEVCLNLSLD